MCKWLICLLFLLPTWALAAPDTPYDPALMLHYPRLTAAQQQVFDLAYEAAAAGEKEVSLPAGTAYDDASAAMDALLLDCPELCALASTYSLRYYQDTPHQATDIVLGYDLPLSSQDELLQAAAALAAQAQGDEFAREEYLHDALCVLTTYDGEAANQHNAYGALVEGRAVCDGYAKAMTLLLRLAGMECGVVQGQMAEGDHAWNLVRVDGAYTWLDVTNDDQAELNHFYFNITDDSLFRTHTLQTPDMPACTDMSVNWYVRKGLYVQGETLLFPAGAGSMELRFAQQADYLTLRDEMNAWLMQSGIQGQVVYWYSDEQQCILVRLEDD